MVSSLLGFQCLTLIVVGLVLLRTCVFAQDYSKEENSDIRVNLPRDFREAPSEFMRDMIAFKDIRVAGVDYTIGPQGPPPEESSSNEQPSEEREGSRPRESEQEERRQSTEHSSARPFQGFQMKQPSDESSATNEEAEKYRKRMSRDPPSPDPAYLKIYPRQSSLGQVKLPPQPQGSYYRTSENYHPQQSYQGQPQQPYQGQPQQSYQGQPQQSYQGQPQQSYQGQPQQSYQGQPQQSYQDQPQQSYQGQPQETYQQTHQPQQSYQAQNRQQSFNNQPQDRPYKAQPQEQSYQTRPQRESYRREPERPLPPPRPYEVSAAELVHQPPPYDPQPYEAPSESYGEQPENYDSQQSNKPYRNTQRSDSYEKNRERENSEFPTAQSTAQPSAQEQVNRNFHVQFPEVDYRAREGSSDQFKQAPGSLDSLLKVDPTILEEMAPKQQAETQSGRTEAYQNNPSQFGSSLDIPKVYIRGKPDEDEESNSRESRSGNQYGSSYDIPKVYRNGRPDSDDGGRSSSSSSQKESPRHYGSSYDIPKVYTRGRSDDDDQSGSDRDNSNQYGSSYDVPKVYHKGSAPEEETRSTGYPGLPRRPVYPSYKTTDSKLDSRTLYPSADQYQRRSDDNSTPSSPNDDPHVRSSVRATRFFTGEFKEDASGDQLKSSEQPKGRAKRSPVRLLSQKVAQSSSNPSVLKVFRAYGTSNESYVMSDARLTLDKDGHPSHLLLKTSSPVHQRLGSKGKDKLKPECSKLSSLPLCITDEQYPSEEIKRTLVKNSSLLPKLRASVLVQVFSNSSNTSIGSSNINSSWPGFSRPSSSSSCTSHLTTQFPKRARNGKGQWNIIVNIDIFRQPVVMEICRSTRQPCASNQAETTSILLPSNSSSLSRSRRCFQRWSLKRLVAYQPSQGLYVDKFRFPSSCSCDTILSP